ncbi:hypothetical protein GGS26DRAFT_602576 [Hypomontagnella submonticulosa]|nr:hypothetical protein GGS26DRAFT_602576 [Hypomontagnella submonticulosa]
MEGESSSSDKGKEPARGPFASPVDPSDSGDSAENNNQSRSRRSSDSRGWYPGKTLHGFAVPDPNYDFEEKRRLIMKNRAEGNLFSVGAEIEDDPETAAAKEVARWEQVTGKKANEEQRREMINKVIRNREGSWLAGAKIEAQGLDKVPIEWFNRLVAEREDSLALITQRALEWNNANREKHAEILKLLAEIKKLKKQASKDKSNDGSDDESQKKEIQAIKAENDTLKADLAKAKSDLEEKNKSCKQETDALKADLADSRSKLEALEADLAKAKSEQEKKDNKCKEKIAALQEEIDTLKKDLAKAKSDLEEKKKKSRKDDIEKLEAEIDALKADLAKAKSELEENDKNYKDKINKLEAENKSCHEQRKERSDRADELEILIKQHKQIEQVFKDENRDLEKRLRECEKSKKKKQSSATATDKATNDSTDPADSDSSSSEPDEPEKTETNDEGVQVDEPVHFDTIKFIREIKQAKEENKDLREVADDLIGRWLARVADNHNVREFYESVDAMRVERGAFEARIIALYNTLGFPNGDTVTAEEALDEITKTVNEQPEDDMLLRVLALRLVGDVHMAEKEAKAEQTQINTLQTQLELCKTTDYLEREQKERYGIATTEEVRKQVEERTQTYRFQRRSMVDHLFGANGALQQTLVKCPHKATRDAIDTVRSRYLSPINLPTPVLQPARHR